MKAETICVELPYPKTGTDICSHTFSVDDASSGDGPFYPPLSLFFFFS